MLSLKPGVRILGVRPEILIAVLVAERAYQQAGIDLMITSCVEGKHMTGSFHYAGAAVDFRTNNVPPEKLEAIIVKIKTALGGDFDVVIEETHLHVEFQPKEPLTA